MPPMDYKKWDINLQRELHRDTRWARASETIAVGIVYGFIIGLICLVW